MFEIHQGFKRTVAVSYSKADGTPGEIEGMPIWELTPPIGIVTVAADGMSAEVAWDGTNIGAVLTVNADGDLGTGVFPILVSETFDFVAPLGAVAGAVSVSGEVPV